MICLGVTHNAAALRLMVNPDDATSLPAWSIAPKPSLDDILRATGGDAMFSQLSQSDIVGNICSAKWRHCFVVHVAKLHRLD